MISAAATMHQDALQRFGLQASGLSIEETENVACGDGDNPVGARQPVVEFFGRQKLERWQIGFELRSQLVARQDRCSHDERVIIDDDPDVLASSLDAHRESEAVPLPHDFALDSLKWHWIVLLAPPIKTSSAFRMRLDDVFLTGASIGRMGRGRGDDSPASR
jgi:hypothetical protein